MIRSGFVSQVLAGSDLVGAGLIRAVGRIRMVSFLIKTVGSDLRVSDFQILQIILSALMELSEF